MEPVFVKPATHYHDCGVESCRRLHSSSYTDMWSLVALAGFTVCSPNDINWQSDAVFVSPIVNGEFAYPHMFPKGRKCRMIHWMLERPDTTKPFLDTRFDYTWTSDRSILSGTDPELLEPGVKYVTLGSDKRLAQQWPGGPNGKEFDFSHLACPNPRRLDILHRIKATGRTIADNGWGKDRHDSLVASKAMLATHQDNLPMIEPLRYALAWAYDLPILAEKSADFYPFEPDPDTERKPIPQCPELQWVRLKQGVEYDFRKCVEAAL